MNLFFGKKDPRLLKVLPDIKELTSRPMFRSEVQFPGECKAKGDDAVVTSGEINCAPTFRKK